MSRFWFAFILLTISIFREASSSNKKGYYTIVTPERVRLGAVFHVSFTLNDFHKSCWFNMSLKSTDGTIISGSENIEIKPETTKLVELKAPPLNVNEFYGNLEIFGYRGIITKHSPLIFFENDQFWALVETNKPKYKPGELLEFRVICIDQLKRPAKLKDVVIVEIYDGNYNLLKTISDAKLVQGVFRSQFQLSNYPILGDNWEIKVLTIDKRLLGDRKFEVDTYDLPKFRVFINYTKKATIYDDMMLLEINASYFYGKPVAGNLTLIVTKSISSPFPEEPLFINNYQIDGKIEIPLGLKTDLQLRSSYQHQNLAEFYESPILSEIRFNIEAIIVDDLSEEVSETAIGVGVYAQPYKVELQAPSIFNSSPLFSIKVKVFIKDLDDNPIVNTSQPIYIIVGCREKLERYKYGDTVIIRVEYKNDIQKDFWPIEVTNKNYSECFIYAEYGRSKSSKKWLNNNVQLLDMEIITENPQEGQEVEIKIINSEPFEEFSYEVVSKGDIIDSGHRNVPGDQTTYILRLNVTFSMVPKITIYVHLIKNKQFIGQLKDVLIKSAIQNSIEIYTENETRPGAGVYINVTTDEGSYVGLMGLDRSILQNINEKDILNNDYVNAELGNVNTLAFYDPTNFNGPIGDIVTFSNVFPLTDGVGTFGGGGGGFAGGILPAKRIRKLFPESWLFLDFEKLTSGRLNILETVPDSITTWALTGFSINPKSGLTFTRNITDLRVFKEFSVSMDLPTLFKDSEIIEIPVYIRNYLNQDALATITIETSSENLLIFDNFQETSESKQNISRLIAANEIDKILIYMKPLKPGHYNVTVLATSPVGSDAVQKTLNVDPQGIPYAMSKAYLVHLPEEGMQEGEVTIDIPENAVLGSERVEVSVIGDIFGPLMKTLQKLARVPYGNCEENTELIISNSLTLKYLKVLNSSNPSLEKKLRHNIELGYQNQLSFKYLDGSFGSFNQQKERTGDIWQTVFSLWGLRQANEFVPIDPWVIKRGSGTDEDVKNTVFGLMVFLMDEDSKEYFNEVIRKGLEFLYNITDDLEYSPISALSVYGLLLGNHEKAGDYLVKLASSSRLTSKQTLWTRPDTLQAHLKTTAESLINLFESQAIPEQNLLQIVRGLIVSKKGESSVTHMIALQAMITFIEKIFLSKTQLEIRFEDDLNKSGSFEINSENLRVFQTFEVAQNSKTLKIQSKGHGFAVVDVSYNYNLLPENLTSIFTTNISTNKTSKYMGVLVICTSVTMNNTQNKLSKMEVNLQSGFIFIDKNSRDDERISEKIKALQISLHKNKAMVYFEHVQATETCIELTVRRAYKVFNAKPGWVTVSDVYEKDQKSGRSFTINDF
ncbi:thioester-containing protein 1 allele S1-like isoform X2 [Eupeodes corollae]|uniref:thioester-containing protein 1 allele S1-like isoform X2 n=1 Tax=Eupeodes corollae TaxID=290404 RepID=UPI00248FB554|nr:thioester-containing protein 1 allele S1-like isoform X2 [Eupeodes corollae]